MAPASDGHENSEGGNTLAKDNANPMDGAAGRYNSSSLNPHESNPPVSEQRTRSPMEEQLALV